MKHEWDALKLCESAKQKDTEQFRAVLSGCDPFQVALILVSLVVAAEDVLNKTVGYAFLETVRADIAIREQERKARMEQLLKALDA